MGDASRPQPVPAPVLSLGDSSWDGVYQVLRVNPSLRPPGFRRDLASTSSRTWNFYLERHYAHSMGRPTKRNSVSGQSLATLRRGTRRIHRRQPFWHDQPRMTRCVCTNVTQAPHGLSLGWRGTALRDMFVTVSGTTHPPGNGTLLAAMFSTLRFRAFHSLSDSKKAALHILTLAILYSIFELALFVC